MTLPVARDLSAAGIRLNTVAPGLIDTPIYDAFPDPAGTGVGQDTPQRVADGSMPGGVRGDGAPGG